METWEQCEAVRTREDLAAFICRLHEELRARPIEWENHTLDSYLEALSGWTTDMPGWFKNRGVEEPPEPSWNILAQMLYAATMYE